MTVSAYRGRATAPIAGLVERVDSYNVVALEDVLVSLVSRTCLHMVIPGHLCTCVAVPVDEQKSRRLHDLLRIGQKTATVSGHHLESPAGPFLTDGHSIGD